MSNVTNLHNLLIGGSIVTPKSGVLIQDIHTVEYKGANTYVIGGTYYDWTYGLLSQPKPQERWTTIELSDY